MPIELMRNFTVRLPLGRMTRLLLLLLVYEPCVVGRTVVASEPKENSPVVFGRDVLPILSSKCFACHGFDASHREAGLRLDRAEGAYEVLESGSTAIKPGALEESEVWNRICSSDPDLMMPPHDANKQITSEERAILGRWIESGAKYAGHWAFEPIARPDRSQMPATNPASEAIDNPFDLWIGHGLRAKGFDLALPADNATLLRRLSFDLTGLPPTPEELDAYEQDSSEQGTERQIDRLLASPRYGERMAQMWLDLARYGDTNGYLHDLKRTSWPWRDWVIDSFNKDLSFDQFVIEQIAGDLLPQATNMQILATSFNRNHLLTTEGGSLEAEFLNEYSADRVQTFGTAFLGLSFNCCRCHDHKFDPLTQDDFYSLQSFFNSIDEKHDNSIQYAPTIEVSSPLQPDGDKIKVMVMKESAQPTKTFVLQRGQYDLPSTDHPVSRKPPKVLSGVEHEPFLNRLQLAHWLVSQENTLFARVAVNRVWQRIFERGIVATVDDFGVQGDYPSHPELLDELAALFRDGDAARGIRPWSMKGLLKAILTSHTYRQASKVREDLKAVDPENQLLGYFPRQRLSAEEVRDQALFFSGLMVETMGGPPVYPYQPEGLWEERSNEASDNRVYVRSEGADLYRRSLYTFWKRTCPPPMMSIFDAPDRTSCTVRRSSTNTPLQALATLNDEQMLECARSLAIRTIQEIPESKLIDSVSTPMPHEAASDVERVFRICRRTTSHFPSEQDTRTLLAGLRQLRQRFESNALDASRIIEQGVAPNPKEIPPSELAAWMIIASTVLNFEATLVRD